MKCTRATAIALVTTCLLLPTLALPGYPTTLPPEGYAMRSSDRYSSSTSAPVPRETRKPHSPTSPSGMVKTAPRHQPVSGSSSSLARASPAYMQDSNRVKLTTATADVKVQEGASFEFRAAKNQQQAAGTNEISVKRAAIEWACPQTAGGNNKTCCQPRWVVDLSTSHGHSVAISGFFNATASAKAGGDYSKCAIVYSNHSIRFKVDGMEGTFAASSLTNSQQTRIAECYGFADVSTRRSKAVTVAAGQCLGSPQDAAAVVCGSKLTDELHAAVSKEKPCTKINSVDVRA